MDVAKNSMPNKLQYSRGELDPAVDDHKSCKKNSLFILSCIGKRTKQGCDSGSKEG